MGDKSEARANNKGVVIELPQWDEEPAALLGDDTEMKVSDST